MIKPDYSTLHPALRSGMERYIENRIEPGSFLKSVLQNDLMKAVGRADSEQMAHLAQTCLWVYNMAPGDCWGSPARVQAWLDAASIADT